MNNVDRRRRLFSFVIVMFCPTVAAPVFAQGELLWQRTIGGTDREDASAIAVDGQDSVVVFGNFSGTVDFGGGEVTATGVFSDGFIAKYDSAGHYIWVRPFADDVRAIGVVVDSVDNILITGDFFGTVDFGGGPVTASGHSPAFFIAKYGGAGDYIWSKTFDVVGQVEPLAMAIDASDNVVISGGIGGTLDFGGGPLNDTGGPFIAKYDSAGNHVWSKIVGGLNFDSRAVGFVTFDNLGNVVLSGGFSGTVDFGGGEVIAAGSEDLYITKYDSAGNYLWTKTFSHTGTFFGAWGLAVDGIGNIAMIGEFDEFVDFGQGPLTAAGIDTFIAKFDSVGNHLWSRALGPIDSSRRHEIAVDSSGNVVVTGGFSGTADFGAGPVITNGGIASDTFVAEYSSAGNHLWSKTFGGTDDDRAEGIDVDSSGNLVVIGEFSAITDFGDGPVTPAGISDIFIVKLGGSGCSGPAGDVNDDGSVTPGDAQEAFDSFLGLSTPDCIDNGDVCPVGGDGSVTPGDAQGIFNMFLGLPTPCE